MPDTALKILYLDPWLAVIDKPSGLLSVAGRGTEKADCVVARAKRLWPEACEVHRLDQDTSGIIVIACDSETQRRLHAAFAERIVDKRYIAIAAGHMDADYGEIDLPLMKDWPNRPLQKVDHEHGKPSQTRWRVLRRTEMSTTDGELPVTRVELVPLTGRSHQLRLHLREIGHPILGDTFYAPPVIVAAAPRLLLHAAMIRFRHPWSNEQVTFHCECPF
jgi:tRNA pseudouridine32 synthase / 23S rRNA pseudouridine746 synthase